MHVNEWVQKNVSSDDYVVITGSTSGIGYCYLTSFAATGCNIICVSNEKEKLEEQKKDFEAKTSSKIINFHADLRDGKETKRLANELARFSVKVLVNNAGFGLKGRFENQNVDDFLDIIAVNVSAPVILTRAILPQMQQRNSGLVIHLASINALIPIPNNQIYTATKAFIYSYALAVARENKKSNIQFQLVLPGTTRTPFHDRQGANPQKLVMMPEDVVKASLDNVMAGVCIPNKADRALSKVIPFVPKNTAMDLAAYMLKKRLGV